MLFRSRTEKFKKLGLLKEADDDEKEFFLIDRLCNLYRTKSWIKEDYISNKYHAREEVKPKFGIVIFDTNNGESNIENAIDSVLKLNYNPNKIKVVISSYKDNNISFLVEKTEKLKQAHFVSSLVVNHTEYEQIIEYDAFSKCLGANYLVRMWHDCILDPELLNKVDNSLNEELEQIALFESNKVQVVHFNVANTQYPIYNNFDKMVENLRKIGRAHV